MSTIKTCEEYVLRELENAQRENKVLKADKQFLEEQYDEIKKENKKQYDEIEKENKRLKEFIKKLTSEAEFDTCSDGKTAAIHINLYGWHEDDRELMNELKKYKEVKEGNES